jgi:hypothetical protein
MKDSLSARFTFKWNIKNENKYLLYIFNLKVIREFKNGAARILVSTDIIGGGIYPFLASLVINYDFPQWKE